MLTRNLYPVWLGILVLSGMFLTGQQGWSPPPPPPPVEVEISILVQVDPLYPTEFEGLAAGDPVPDAEVVITKGSTGEVVASGFSNSEGGVVLGVLGPAWYSIHVVADTSEPECWWMGRVEYFLVGREPEDVTLDVWPDGPDCVGPPVEASILVQVDPQYPNGFGGLVAGDPVPNAEFEITKTATGEIVASGTTGPDGRILVELPGTGRYYIHVSADTPDPYCWWTGGGEFVVGTEPIELTVDVWAICA